MKKQSFFLSLFAVMLVSILSVGVIRAATNACPSDLDASTCNELVNLRNNVMQRLNTQSNLSSSAAVALQELALLKNLNDFYTGQIGQQIETRPYVSQSEISRTRKPSWKPKTEIPPLSDRSTRPSNYPYFDVELLDQKTTSELIKALARIESFQANTRIRLYNEEALQTIHTTLQEEICRRNPDAHRGTRLNPGEKICTSEE